MSGLITVGVDNSTRGGLALDWAVQEAGRRDAALRIVHVLDWPLQLVEGFHSPRTREALMAESQGVVDGAVERALELDPHLVVEGWLDVGHTAGTLVERSSKTDLLVVGEHSGGKVSRHFLGSTTSHLLSHARSPLVIVREQQDPKSTEVLVGVDDKETSKEVLHAAFEEAELRQAPVHLLHTYSWPVAPAGALWVTPLYPTEGMQEEEELLLAEASAGARADFPEVPVRTSVLCESTGAALVSASARAAVLVVGAHGRGGFTGMLLGSVARLVAHHAQCPVLVVRT